MIAFMIIGFAVVVAIFLIFFFVGAGSRTPSEITGERVDWDAIADEELQSYLPHEKINAIKRYRLLTGADLKGSKEAVEYAMAYPQGIKKAKFSDRPVDTDGAGVRDLIAEGRIDEAVDVYAAFMGVDEYTARDAIKAVQQDMDAAISLSNDGLNTVHDLLDQGKKIEAIKQYRALTGAGLKTAKDAVEDMEL